MLLKPDDGRDGQINSAGDEHHRLSRGEQKQRQARDENV